MYDDLIFFFSVAAPNAIINMCATGLGGVKKPVVAAPLKPERVNQSGAARANAN